MPLPISTGVHNLLWNKVLSFHLVRTLHFDPYRIGRVKRKKVDLYKTLYLRWRAFCLRNMNERFHHPFTCVVAEPISCGKTEFVAKFIQHVKQMMTPTPQRVVWCYGGWQRRTVPTCHWLQNCASIRLRNNFWWNFCLAVYFHCFWMISRRWFQKCDYVSCMIDRWLSVRLFTFVGSTLCQPGKMNYTICNSKSLERATKNHNDCKFCTIKHCTAKYRKVKGRALTYPCIPLSIAPVPHSETLPVLSPPLNISNYAFVIVVGTW